jgi:hypothetical protein
MNYILLIYILLSFSLLELGGGLELQIKQMYNNTPNPIAIKAREINTGIILFCWVAELLDFLISWLFYKRYNK